MRGDRAQTDTAIGGGLGYFGMRSISDAGGRTHGRDGRAVGAVPAGLEDRAGVPGRSISTEVERTTVSAAAARTRDVVVPDQHRARRARAIDRVRDPAA